jgi:hypothetical protein
MFSECSLNVSIATLVAVLLTGSDNDAVEQVNVP